MTYTLTKLELEDGKYSMLPAGYSTRGVSLSLFDWEDGENGKTNKNVSLKEVDVGWQVILTSLRDYHRTSKIREIVSRDKHRVVFKTQTSMYELVEHEE